MGNNILSRRCLSVGKKAHNPMRFVFPPIKISVPIPLWSKRKGPKKAFVFVIPNVFLNKRNCRSVWRASGHVNGPVFCKPVQVLYTQAASPDKKRASVYRARGFVRLFPVRTIVFCAHAVPVNLGFRTVFNFASHSDTLVAYARNVKRYWE